MTNGKNHKWGIGRSCQFQTKEAHMSQNSATRRTFIGTMATALGVAGLRPSFDLFAQERQARQGEPGEEHPDENYDEMAKLASNENCWGPSDDVVKAMRDAFK